MEMMLLKNSLFFLLLCISGSIIAQKKAVSKLATTGDTATCKTKSCCTIKAPNRFAVQAKQTETIKQPGTSVKKLDGMVWIEGGTFSMGADNNQGRQDEYPKHSVKVNGFYMDATEVTNEQFATFVKASGYKTLAEKDVNWEVMKKQVPPGTAKPPAESLKAASLVFVQTKTEVDISDYSQWWQWKQGANWKHPQGPGSDLIGKEKLPVVHICWEDAMAYCKWAGKRLPTEAEWEYASRGGLANNIYSWGNEPVNSGVVKCNYWQGSFPVNNENKDGYERAAAVKSFAPNAYGLYDMAGNVWEWCSDLYSNTYYTECSKNAITVNPKGPKKSYDPDEPLMPKRVIRGGSFLCNESYCSGYRVAARMKTSPDSGMEHLGFRCVADK